MQGRENSTEAKNQFESFFKKTKDGEMLQSFKDIVLLSVVVVGDNELIILFYNC